MDQRKFNLTFKEADLFKKVIDILQAFVKTTHMTLDSKEGLIIETPDDSTIAHLELRLTKEAFDSFVITERNKVVDDTRDTKHTKHRCVQLGISLEHVHKFTKMANDSILSLACNIRDPVELDIIHEHKTQKSKKEFSLKLLELDIHQLDVPNNSLLMWSGRVATKELAIMLRDVASFSDIVKISIQSQEDQKKQLHPHMLCFTCDCDFLESGSLQIPIHLDTKSTLDKPGKYKVSCLKNFVKHDLSTEAQILIREDKLLVIKFLFTRDTENWGSIRLCLAPIIE